MPNITLAEGIKHAARIILIAHGDNSGKDKDYELEMTWVRADDAGSGYGKHEAVPKDLLDEAAAEAKKAVDGDDEEDEKMAEST